MKQNSLHQKALTYAFVLLKVRPRSIYELTERLTRKRFDEATIREVVQFLIDKRFLDDVEFAHLWVESRLKKPYGPRRIQQELRQKGIDEELIHEALAARVDTQREAESVRELALKKMLTLRNVDERIAKQRVWGFLTRRGFSPDIISETLQDL